MRKGYWSIESSLVFPWLRGETRSDGARQQYRSYRPNVIEQSPPCLGPRLRAGAAAAAAVAVAVPAQMGC